MQIEKLPVEDKDAFVEFCLKHKDKVDDSFLHDEDLENFTPNGENPTFIIKKNGNIVAVASLIIDDYHKRGRRGRFRIFYSENDNPNSYSALLSEVTNHVKEIDKVFLFVPLTNGELSETIKSLHFEVERYVYILVKELREPEIFSLPNGYSIREFQADRDEEAWCHIRNTAFANLKGNSTPITPEMVRKQMSDSDYLEGGLLFLMHQNAPVGIIRGTNDEYEGKPAMNIGPLGILPAYQGKGLGRQLLRAALDLAQKRKYKKAILCVNAENERAKELYVREGFVEIEGVVAYEYVIKSSL